MILFSFIYRDVWFYNFLYLLIIALTSIYIIYDTKLIMEYLGPDEYIIGAIMLYVDLIQIFLYLLALCGGGGR